MREWLYIYILHVARSILNERVAIYILHVARGINEGVAIYITCS